MEFVTLNNQIKMPALGFGVYQITEAEQCELAVLDAIHTGCRLIDTAMSYHNEEAVGLAIQKCGVPREELFITTKLWLADTGYDKTIKAFETSLRKLGLMGFFICAGHYISGVFRKIPTRKSVKRKSGH